MSHQEGTKQGIALPEDGSIPDFLKREAPITGPQQESPMRDDNEAADATVETETPATPPAKPAKAPVKRKATAKAAKPAKASAKGNGHAKPAAKAKGKATAAKGKGSPKAERQRDLTKLDQWGFRKDSIKSRAAAMYAKGKGATLSEVKEAVGSVQFNLLNELEGHGHAVDRSEVKNAAGRMVTRYKLIAKAA